MRESPRALDELRDELARAQREIGLLEQIGRQLAAIVDDGCGEDAYWMIQRHLDEIAERTIETTARLRAVVRTMKELKPGRRRRTSNQ